VRNEPGSPPNGAPAEERKAAEAVERATAERQAEEDRQAAARREPDPVPSPPAPRRRHPPAEPAAATVAATGAVPIPGRVALVIGNGAYTSVPGLPNPANDAADVAAVLERLGFRVLKGIDLERDAMVDLVEEFARAASEAEVALAYFAGHGLQVRDVNYLIPVDGRVQDEFGLRRLVRLDELIEDTGRARKLALVVVDACRDNPFVAGLQRSLGASRAASVGGGLAAPAVATTQTLVAYATAAKAVAADGTEGARNSPFTAALVKHLVEPEDIRIVFGRVRDSVVAATNGTQRPDIWGSLGGERIVLAPPEASARTWRRPSPPPSAPRSGPRCATWAISRPPRSAASATRPAPRCANSRSLRAPQAPAT
jgi:uncharacterized caspase-like protein